MSVTFKKNRNGDIAHRYTNKSYRCNYSYQCLEFDWCYVLQNRVVNTKQNRANKIWLHGMAASDSDE